MRWSLATVALVPRGATAHVDLKEQRRIFEWAAAAGFQGVEISPQWLDIAHLSDTELRIVRDEAAANGLAMSGLNVNRVFRRVVHGSSDTAHHSLLERAIDVAAILAAPLVTLSFSLPLDGSSRPLLRGCDASQAERDQNADLIRGLAARARTRGVQLSLELHDDGLLDTAELCLDMLERVRRRECRRESRLGQSRAQQSER